MSESRPAVPGYPPIAAIRFNFYPVKISQPVEATIVPTEKHLKSGSYADLKLGHFARTGHYAPNGQDV